MAPVADRLQTRGPRSRAHPRGLAVRARTVYERRKAEGCLSWQTAFERAVGRGGGQRARCSGPGETDAGRADRPAPGHPVPTLVAQTVRRRDILFNQTNDSVGYLQDVLGLTPDRFFGPKETQRFTKEQFGWNGKKPMTEALFRKLFPASVFELDATVDPVIAKTAVPTQRTGTARQPTPV